MSPQDQTFTSRQKWFVVSTLLLIFLAFGSVFGYAYVRGAQVRKAGASPQPNALVWSRQAANWRAGGDIKRRCIQIACGAKIQLPMGKSCKCLDKSRVWTINQFSRHEENKSLLRPRIISYITAPGAWSVSPVGLVTIPRKAEPGLYQIHYWVEKQTRDYFIEVVPPSRSSHSRQSHSPNQK